MELSGVDHLPYVGDADAIVEEVQEFLIGVRALPDHDRVLATVLFTDIVASTDKASVIGDQVWRELLQRHDDLIRRELGAFRGVEIHTTGDGFLATFDGPARAIRFARSIVDAVHDIGLQIRAGVHTGEIELMGDQVGGIAVHIGARVAAMADADQVLVSGTVKDLVAGSGIEFEDRGSHVEGRTWAVEGVRRDTELSTFGEMEVSARVSARDPGTVGTRCRHSVGEALAQDRRSRHARTASTRRLDPGSGYWSPPTWSPLLHPGRASPGSPTTT